MTTSDKIASVAVLVSILAAVFSWIIFRRTDKLARNGYLRNYRPYVAGANFGYIDKNDGKWYPQMNVLMVKTFNAPAIVTSIKLSFYAREDNNDSLIFQQPETINCLLYPFESQQFTLTTAPKIINGEIAQQISPRTLIRKVKIEYQWISDSTLQYHFEAEWKFVVGGSNWENVYQSAD